MWIKKYKSGGIDDIAGNPKLIQELKSYNWKKPLLIYGPPGIGKSALVEAIVKEFDFDLVEITDENLGNAIATAQTASIFGRRKLILIDNVDQIKDMRKITELLKETKNPTVLVTSDFSSKRLATIKKICEKAQMRRLTAKGIEKLLRDICDGEGISPEDGVLNRIAENSGGDIRSAINDLETLAKGKKNVSLKDTDILGVRDRSVDIYKVLNTILMKKDFNEAVRSMYDLDEQPRDVLLWIDENMPRVYRGGDVERAYRYIAKADIFLGRIIRRQYWGFLRYVSPLMSGGVNISKSRGVNFTMYKFPSYIIKMSQTKKDRAIKKSIGQKLSPLLHVSGRMINREYIPLFRTLLKNGKIGKDDLMEKYRLGVDEIEYLIG
jgi:replication factor C large subunit